ncbi:MAG: hypothetical protein M3S32_07395 [Acidobacteriota bacterium]|nr:hypothetical protein [Acidobacteriota bacterium]
MLPPRGFRPRARLAAAILGLILGPAFIALGETLRAGSARVFCFVAAGAAAIAAVALIADSLEVYVDPQSRARSSRRSSARMPVRKGRDAGSS